MKGQQGASVLLSSYGQCGRTRLQDLALGVDSRGLHIWFQPYYLPTLGCLGICFLPTPHLAHTQKSHPLPKRKVRGELGGQCCGQHLDSFLFTKQIPVPGGCNPLGNPGFKSPEKSAQWDFLEGSGFRGLP